MHILLRVYRVETINVYVVIPTCKEVNYEQAKLRVNVTRVYSKTACPKLI